jgi:hypothetical protein
MWNNKKCSEKGALSGHVIQLSIKTLTSKFGKWINPIVHASSFIEIDDNDVVFSRESWNENALLREFLVSREWILT